MNRLNHLIFAFWIYTTIFVGIFFYSMYLSGDTHFYDMLLNITIGGFAVSFILVPIFYSRANVHKERPDESFSSHKATIGALFLVSFSFGILATILIMSYYYHIPIIGNINIPLGALITIIGGLVPDWDIILMGVGAHRNILFHSAIVPLIFTAGGIYDIVSHFLAGLPLVTTDVQYFLMAMFLIGYASHLMLDIYPSNKNIFDLIWRVISPFDEAPTGIKGFGKNLTKRQAKSWLYSNASLLILYALILMAAYFGGIL